MKNMGVNDRLGVVSFAEKAFPERAPAGASPFGTFVSESSPDASDLNAAIDQAISLIPSGDMGRILVLSDGRWTGENPNRLVPRLMQRNIAVDYRLLERPVTGDIAIVAFETPGLVLPNEVFTINAWIRVPTTQEIEYELFRNDQLLVSGKRVVRSGDERLVFRDSTGKAGTLEYNLRIRAAGGADVLLHTSNSHASAVDALNGLRPWGKLVVMGIATDEMNLPADMITNQAYEIIGSAHNGNEYLVEALELVAQGKVKPMTDLYPKERVGDAFEASSTGRARFRSVVTF